MAAPGALDHEGLQPGITRPCPPGQPLASTLVVSGTQTGPGCQTPGEAKAGHVDADFCQDPLTPPLMTVKLLLLHGGEEKEVTVTLGTFPEEGTEGTRRLGMTLRELTPEVAERLGLLADAKGVAVTAVEAGGAAPVRRALPATRALQGPPTARACRAPRRPQGPGTAVRSRSSGSYGCAPRWPCTRLRAQAAAEPSRSTGASARAR
jgi:hypothetical protein